MSDIIDRVAHRVKTAVGKALIKAVVDTGDIQLVKIAGLSGEVQDGIERIQNYGMSSSPPVDSEAVAVCIGGSKDHTVVIAADSGAYRVKALPTGEVVVYSMFGQEILLKTDGSVEITAPAGVDVGTGSSPVALSSVVDQLWTQLNSAFTSWIPVAQDGGAALRTSFLAAFPSAPSSTASSNLRAD